MKRACGWVDWRDYKRLNVIILDKWDRVKEWRPGTCHGIFQSADVDESRPTCVIETSDGELVEVAVNNVVFLPDAGVSPTGLTPEAAAGHPLSAAAPSIAGIEEDDILGGAPLNMPERTTISIPITQRAVDRWFDGLRSAITRRGRRQRRIEAARRARYGRETSHD